jgi:hypothetical protein
MTPDFWNTLHDGSIVSWQGTVPGDLRFVIELEYVREQFSDPGRTFTLTVTGCEFLKFKSFRTDLTQNGVDALKGQNLEILSAEILSARPAGQLLEIMTSDGIIGIRYLTEELALDGGRRVSLIELQTAANNGMRGGQ